MIQLKEIVQAQTDGIILRNKGISEEEYEKWVKEIKDQVAEIDGFCRIHHYWETAKTLGSSCVHVSFYQLRENPLIRECAQTLGVSVHSVKQAVRAWKMGADYLMAGHIYNTSCKEGLPGRGVSFLRQVCQAVPIPVYAIGGIGLTDYDKIREVIRAKAGGVCIMSGFMKSENPQNELECLRNYVKRQFDLKG